MIPAHHVESKQFRFDSGNAFFYLFKPGFHQEYSIYMLC